jgi:hypothetical protein
VQIKQEWLAHISHESKEDCLGLPVELQCFLNGRAHRDCSFYFPELPFLRISPLSSSLFDHALDYFGHLHCIFHCFFCFYQLIDSEVEGLNDLAKSHAPVP